MTDVTPDDSVTEYEPEPIYDDADEGAEVDGQTKGKPASSTSEPPESAGDPAI